MDATSPPVSSSARESRHPLTDHADSPGADDAARSIPALLRDRTFGPYLAANLLSNVGTWFHDVAAAIVIYDLTGSAAMTGGVAIAGYGTALLLAPLGGQLADRYDRRKLLLVSHVLLALVTGVLAALVAAGLAGPWVLLGMTGLIGIGRAVNSPALSAFVPSMVHRRDLPSALALHAVTFHLSRALGPVLGALTVAWLGAASAFTINALSFAVFAAVMAVGSTVSRADRTVDRGFRAGLRYVRARPSIVLLLVLGTVTGMGSDPVITLGPSIAADLGRGEAFVGLLVSAFGGGAMLAVPFLARIRRTLGGGRTGLYAMFWMLVGLVVLALASSPEVATVGAFVGGFGFLLSSTDLSTSLQELLDEHVRGRVMALWTMGFLGSRPLAAALNGTIADAATPAVAILVLVAVIGAVAVAGLGLRSRYLGVATDGV